MATKGSRNYFSSDAYRADLQRQKQLRADILAASKIAQTKQMLSGTIGKVEGVTIYNDPASIYFTPSVPQEPTMGPIPDGAVHIAAKDLQPGDQITWGMRKYITTVANVFPRRRDVMMSDGHSQTFEDLEAGEGIWLVKRPVPLEPPKPERVPIDFDSVIIADDKRQQILEALEQVNKSTLIFDTWGFGETMEKGKGVAMLFYGEPGTGKTLMGQAIADKLGRKLKVIGTADVESSAPGEAERNIRKHFADATKDKTILLFDECDNLIHSREMVGPIMAAQINELLSQVERHEGITIFTTNRLGTLDEAVSRRLALKLEFPMPSPSQRVEIWQRMFPKKAPLADDIDWMALAGVEITGGYIKNTVLRAARMAAIEPVPNRKKRITMQHLVRALRLEAGSMLDFDAARKNYLERGVHVTNSQGMNTATGQKTLHVATEEAADGNL